MRHVEVCQLWVQQDVSQCRINMVNVKGTENPADRMTKHVDNETLSKHLDVMDLERRKDRHVMSPMVAEDEGVN